MELPKTQAVSELPSDENTVVLTLKADGGVFLNEVQTQSDTLAAQLVATVKSQNKELFLKADKDVPYGAVVEMMGRIKAAGITRLGIVAEQVDDTISSSVQDTSVTEQAGTGSAPGPQGTR